MKRRDFLRFVPGALLCTALRLPAEERSATTLSQRVRAARGRAVLRDGNASSETLHIQMNWAGDSCRPNLTNRGPRPLRVDQIILAEINHGLPPETAIYGESFQMLSQTAGTIAQPVDLGYSELKHYRLPQPEGATALTGLVTFHPPAGKTTVLGFTSCRRFVGRFFLQGESLQIVVDAEGLQIAPGETWELEELFIAEGDRDELLSRVAKRITQSHPRRLFRPIPTGWCSWYCFGPRVTAKQVLDNLDVIAKSVPTLKYIQIDDGYQPAMGDWLETGTAFGGDVRSVLRAIRERGLEPAIWVAPFIAEAKSHVLQNHPEWFVQGADGQPLPADRVTFGGWRHGPWYALDGTHPEVQKHFEQLFRTLRHEWGCTYFKLDANFWGAIHGGRFHDLNATRIEAYRRGMEAIGRGAGDAFILGCNHPIWASFGLIDGSRSSGDIKRSWAAFSRQARQTLMRNWQDGVLWWNDPDAVLLTGDLSDDEFQFHVTATYASGGMVLSGDDLTKITPTRLAMLRKLLPPTEVAARFEDDSLRVGWIHTREASMTCIFNWTDAPETVLLRLPRRCSLIDYWSGENLGVHRGNFTFKDLPPHSARLILCR